MKLIAECKHWWRLWTVWLAGLASLLAGFLSAYPGALTQLVAYVPEGWRPLATLFAMLVTFAVPTALRLVPQKKLQEARDAAAS